MCRTTRLWPSRNPRVLSTTSSVGYTIAYDTRNLPQSPTSGIFTSFSQDFAGVGGDVQYFRSVVDARGYYPITNKITLVGRAQAGRSKAGAARMSA